MSSHSSHHISHIFIPGNVPSSKNSKRMLDIKTRNGSSRRIVAKSALCKEYEKNASIYFLLRKPLFLSLIKDKPLPLKISFRFVRDSKRKFDYINPCQTIQDLMQTHGWIKDDNADNLIPFFEPYEYNTSSPGVYITVL